MASTSTVTEANGIAKRVMGNITELLPDKDLKLQRHVKVDTQRKVGAEFEEVVPLTFEHGFTAGGTTGAARTLNAAIVEQTAPARFTPPTVHFRTAIVHDLLSATQSRGTQAYEVYIDGKMRRARRAFDRREEQRLIYGGLPLGNIDATATHVSTTLTFVISDNTWAPGPWIGGANMQIDAYNGSSQLNTNAAMTILTVDPATRTMTATCNASDITAIEAATTSVQFYYRGYYGLDGTGVAGVASLSASSSSYLGIAGSTYKDLWCATQVTWDQSTTTMTWGLLNSGIEQALGRGMTGDVVALCSIKAWRDLCATTDSLREIDSSYSASSTELGFSKLKYHHCAGGVVTVEPSTFIKKSHVIVMADPEDPMNDIKILGSDEPTYGIPSIQGEDIFTQVQGTNYVEMGMFARRGLWAPCPRNFVLFAP